jgi:multiple sugar transport system permease protein
MKKRKGLTAASYILLIGYAVMALIPFLYMLTTAMTPRSYSMPYPPKILPDQLYFGNFSEAWNANNFSQYFVNSLGIAALSTVIIMFVSSISAYAFARLKFPGRDVIFYLYLFSMMVPTVTNLIPQFLLMRDLKLVDTYTGLLMIYIGIGVPSNTYFLRNFFLTLPKELEEAASIDGASTWKIFWNLILPLSKPALGTFAILAFSNVWDEFLIALTMIKTPSKRTLPIALQLFQGQHLNDWGLIFAASLIAVAPIMLIYIVMQKKLIRGGAIDGMLKE